jgi:DNA-binding transcriptional LysR family regulator
MESLSAEHYPDWDLLISWVCVVESGSMSDAADRLGISQGGVSQRIKALETLLDTTLLDRGSRPARPTAAGRRLFEHATDLLHNVDQMVESVRNVTRAKRTVVRLGAIDSFAAMIGPILTRALAGSAHQIRLWSGITPSLDAQLEARQLDVTVTMNGYSRVPEIKRLKLFSEPYFLVLPKAFEVDRLTTLADLGKQLQFVRYSARSINGQQVDAYLSAHGEYMERTCEFDATDPLLSLVAAGLGFALTTPLCIWQTRHYLPDIRVIPLSALSRHGRASGGLQRAFYLAFRENELGSLPANLFDLFRNTFERQVAPDIAQALSLDSKAIFIVDDYTETPVE